MNRNDINYLIFRIFIVSDLHDFFFSADLKIFLVINTLLDILTLQSALEWLEVFIYVDKCKFIYIHKGNVISILVIFCMQSEIGTVRDFDAVYDSNKNFGWHMEDIIAKCLGVLGSVFI